MRGWGEEEEEKLNLEEESMRRVGACRVEQSVQWGWGEVTEGGEEGSAGGGLGVGVSVSVSGKEGRKVVVMVFCFWLFSWFELGGKWNAERNFSSEWLWKRKRREGSVGQSPQEWTHFCSSFNLHFFSNRWGRSTPPRPTTLPFAYLLLL